MIPIFLMISGVLAAFCGLLILIRALIVSWWKRKFRSIDGEMELEDNYINRRNRRRDIRHVSSIGLTWFILGAVMFFSGWYLGYADKGDGFFFNKLLYGEEAVACWDSINDEGQYVDENGNIYSYYLVVRGNEFEFCGEKCDSIETVKQKLNSIRRENTVMLIDSFAVASQYIAAKDLLNELGIKYETEEV